MIKNLSIYSEWKKSTLMRVTTRYRAMFMRVIEAHIKALGPEMLKALEDGDSDIRLDFRGLDAKLRAVMEKHQADTVHVGVSDGMREVDPQTKLSSWERFPIHMPVEDTFTGATELRLRNSYSQRIAKEIRSANKKTLADLLGLTKKKYLGFVKTTFRSLVEDYLTNENTDDTKDLIKNAIKKIYARTDSQAETMFRTETTRYFNDARLNYFKSNTDVDFVQLVAVTDGRISNICECRDGYVIPIGKAANPKYKPPFHPNCRTIQSPLDTDLSSDTKDVTQNLGAEFGKIKSKTSGQVFTGKRAAPRFPIAPAWLRWKHA